VGKEHRTEEWLDYFDVVITGCGKPAFFEVKKPLFEVDTKTGALYNTDNGTPMIPIGVFAKTPFRAVRRVDSIASQHDHCAACMTISLHLRRNTVPRDKQAMLYSWSLELVMSGSSRFGHQL